MNVDNRKRRLSIILEAPLTLIKAEALKNGFSRPGTNNQNIVF